jgi:hypothetical protein
VKLKFSFKYWPRIRRKIMKLRIGWMTALLSCLIAPGVAAAEPTFGTQASAEAGDKNSGTIVGAGSATATEEYRSEGGSANALASASIGDLSVETMAAANPPPECDNGCGNVSAIAFADFFDTLTVTDPAEEIAHFGFGLRTDAVVSPGGEGAMGALTRLSPQREKAPASRRYRGCDEEDCTAAWRPSGYDVRDNRGAAMRLDVDKEPVS